MFDNVLEITANKSVKYYIALFTCNVSNLNNFRFRGDFQNCLCQICGYKRLTREVEMMRKTPYSQENPEHEEKLMKVTVYNSVW